MLRYKKYPLVTKYHFYMSKRKLTNSTSYPQSKTEALENLTEMYVSSCTNSLEVLAPEQERKAKFYLYLCKLIKKSYK